MSDDHHETFLVERVFPYRRRVTRKPNARIKTAREQMARFLNHYECTNCGNSWQDEWSCACDDRCPVCGTVTEPHHSDVFGETDDGGEEDPCS